MSEGSNVQFSEREALLFHSQGRPGKIQIVATKPMATQRDLSLAYSPGVAVPVRAIAADPATAYDYTAKGNLVAVISNGTAILGLGNLGALASKPVMEGKAVLFKRFADVDSIDLELATEDPEAFINAVALLEPSFGGINLEDIKAPECFIIEQALKERMNIPVMHDDQHGTAIIAAAGLINAAHLTGRDLKDMDVVVNGAGAAAIACTELIKAVGVPRDRVLLCDSKGVVYQGRSEGMNQWKSGHAVMTTKRTLAEAIEGADVFLGLSVKGALTPEMVKSMAPNPIIFAMANPDPEITPPEARAVRPDAIIATGRSDYPNQVNNVLGFPFIFRGALDVRATAINEEMKIAAARALAELAREQVPEEVAAAYGHAPRFGRDYIIPAPFDPRLMEVVPAAVAQAAMDSGVARQPILDMPAYRDSLKARLNPTTSVLTLAYEGARARPKRVVFAEADPVPRRRLWHPGARRPRRCARAAEGAGRRRSRQLRAAQQPQLAARPQDGGHALRPPPAARLSAARMRIDGQPGSQHLRRAAARAGRGRRDDHGRHASLFADDATGAPGDRSDRGAAAFRHPCARRPIPHHLHGGHHGERAPLGDRPRRYCRAYSGRGAAHGP
jgi:malate dehydrogenase (oxaloacetate-decarboxylating)(NADP+)